MYINVILVSKLCSELVTVRPVFIDEKNPLLNYKDLQDILYDSFGLHNEYSIFWRYSPELFFEIIDYITFATAMLFGAEGRLYVLMRDYEEPWCNNLIHMKVIDYVDAQARRRACHDPYDVKIIRDGDQDSEVIEQEMLQTWEQAAEPADAVNDADIIAYACSGLDPTTYFTTDFCVQAMLLRALKQVCGHNLLHRLAVTTASFLCLTNILGMKGEIISCPHKDIYFLEANTKSESTDLANMFASPASAAGRGRTIKCKPRTKLKQKYNPALDFFVENKATTKSAPGGGGKEDVSKCGSSGNQSEAGGASASRRNSIDLYEEAATILGLTCSQTDDCKCIECQCHYFDFEDDLDFAPLTSSATLGGEYYVDHNSSCAIQ